MIYSILCTWGRKALVASTKPDAIVEALRYAARNGLHVTLVCEDADCQRVVADIPPTWVADTVLHLVLGAATPDVPARVN